jgi:hypothetical protein
LRSRRVAVSLGTCGDALSPAHPPKLPRDSQRALRPCRAEHLNVLHTNTPPSRANTGSNADSHVAPAQALCWAKNSCTSPGRTFVGRNGIAGDADLLPAHRPRVSGNATATLMALGLGAGLTETVALRIRGSQLDSASFSSAGPSEVRGRSERV